METDFLPFFAATAMGALQVLPFRKVFDRPEVWIIFTACCVCCVLILRPCPAFTNAETWRATQFPRCAPRLYLFVMQLCHLAARQCDAHFIPPSQKSVYRSTCPRRCLPPRRAHPPKQRVRSPPDKPRCARQALHRCPAGTQTSPHRRC